MARLIAALIVLGILALFGWEAVAAVLVVLIIWYVWHYRKHGYWPGDQYHPDFKDPRRP